SYQGDLATIVVANNSDSGPGSLRAAIATAVAGDIITFAPGLASQTITLTSGQLDIPAGKNITIDGAAAPGLTISGNNASRAFFVNANVATATNFAVKNLIITNGKTTDRGGAIGTTDEVNLTVENVQFNNNVADQGGGAIFGNFNNTLTVTNSKFNGNVATSANDERGAGAIGFLSFKTFTVTNSDFTNNKGINGGAINSLQGKLTIDNSRFIGNDTTAAVYATGQNNPFLRGFGGAVYTDRASNPSEASGTIKITNSVFQDNKGRGEGGAAYLFTGSQDKVILEKSTFQNNEILGLPNGGNPGNGGAVTILSDSTNQGLTIANTTFAGNKAGNQGGGLWMRNAPTTITNSTFSGNSTAYAAGDFNKLGGAMTLGAPTTILNTTIADNSAGWVGGGIFAAANNVTLKNTILSNNTAANGGNPWGIQQHVTAQYSDGGGNFQWPAKNPNDGSDFNATASITIADPLLGPLQNLNGALVRPLLAGSPAIDKGIATGAPATDQRGVTRPQDGDSIPGAIVDSGSFELGGSVVPVPTPTPAQALTGSLGQTNNYSSVNDLIAQWPNAAQNQGIKLSGIAFDGFETDYLNPNVISNLTLATNENPKSWLSYGSAGGIGVPSSYDGWFTDATKIRAEINHNPNTNQSQTLKVKWADNQDITRTTIDLSGLSPKTSPGLGDQGNEVGFLQIFNNGVRVPATNFNIARLNAPSAPKPITVSSDGVTLIGDRTDGSFKLQIVGDSLGGATFDELRFSTKAYDSPTAAYAATSFKNDGSDYLVRHIEYQGISNAVPPTFFSYGSSPDPIADGGSGVVTINRTGDTSVSASVDYLIVAPGGGQPANNVDYSISPFAVNPSSGTVNFNAGQTSVSLTINNLPGLTGGVVNLGFGSGSIGAPASTAITLL
ncbi:choice-of-anchor Q domain-containing protein, partial [Microcoleus sp. Pol1C5]|uniref:choice-of-anchor Q domain-containing protein n=2 Tax=unclassified Microcoleus TaxID=2642155 RepID=UPI002FD1853C